ncbi:organoarsenical effux MFS transporter ArsJ [Exilibacterium tricleocarpae]|uniref:Organoarsenical effux MFS transporter ArsJ n=1 Tax=Exilibacterium tricleocarpae TaxID=2591008 RepID=A0A545STI9_9GAMM|nr:organoarsenical effux MFS transporter ArsJ [Exilibacterium tricleocarpae]TQV68284.1 organoarsenical effux MFS transporter ArsJ [Exilibacterium tricleocarpae]
MTAPVQTLHHYALVTGCYWAFTLTDGALRMLVVLYFHQLGYSPLAIASLFLFYELFGVVTNLTGGWLAARVGLNTTMHLGMALQIAALAMLAVDSLYLTIPYVMAAQALSGIAKDLNKMSAKSSIKMLVPAAAQGRLYRWIALLTGSKNALKGIGFFLGAAALAALGFKHALLAMAAVLALALALALALLPRQLGKSRRKPKFKQLFSKSRPINRLSATRLFLFGARDTWFVVALPVYLQTALGWEHTRVGALLALWIIGYGAVQALAPAITGRAAAPPGRDALVGWGLALAGLPVGMALSLAAGFDAQATLIIGLGLFGVLFAVNSSIHSYLIIAYARADGVSLDVGFYYMANAAGRLLGTLLSGVIYQYLGLPACLLAAALLVTAAALLSLQLPRAQVPA